MNKPRIFYRYDDNFDKIIAIELFMEQPGKTDSQIQREMPGAEDFMKVLKAEYWIKDYTIVTVGWQKNLKADTIQQFNLSYNAQKDEKTKKMFVHWLAQKPIP